MSEVITRPKSGKTKAVAPAPTTQQTESAAAVSDVTQRPEWLALALPHVRKLSDFIYTLAGCSEDQKAPELIQALIEEADALLARVWGDESGRWAANDALLWMDLNTVLLLLRSAAYACQHGPLSYSTGVHGAIIEAATAYAVGLRDAVSAAPENLAPLKTLDGNSFLRMKPDERFPARLQEQEAAQATRVVAQPPGDTFQASDIDLVFDTLTSQGLVLRDFIIDARIDLETEGSVTRALSNFRVAEHLSCLIGSMADQMCMARTIGGPADWVTGTNISRKEGAA